VTNRAPFHALTLLALAAGCADPAPDPTPPDDVPLDGAKPADAAPDATDASSPDATADDASSDAAADAAPDVAADASSDAAPDVTIDAPTADAALDATLDTSSDAAIDASLDASPDAAPDASPDAAPDAAPDVATDAPAGDGGVAGGFSPTAAGWVVPPNGLSDGFYATALANGTRWWTLADMNGDGRPDLVQTGDPARTGGYVFGAGTATPTWRVFRNTSTGFATTATAWAVPNIGLNDGPYTASIAAGTRWWATLDLNGDRRADLVQTGDPARTGGYVFGAGAAVNTGPRPHVLHHPRDALVERHRRRPPEHLPRARRVAAEPLHLARRGPHPLGVAHHRHVPARRADHLAREVADADLLALREVERAPDRLVTLGREEEAAHRVADVVEVARRVERAEPHLVAVERLHRDGDEHRPRGLPRPVGVEGPHRHGAEPEGAVVALDALVRADLAGGVGRLPHQRVVFGDGDGLRGAVHLAGGGVDHLRPLLQARLRDVERAEHVGLEDVGGGHVRLRDRDDRAEVEDHVAALHGRADHVGVVEVAEADVDRRADVGGELVEVAEVGAGGVADEGAHAVAARDEGLDEVAPDEARGAGDEGRAGHAGALLRAR